MGGPEYLKLIQSKDPVDELIDPIDHLVDQSLYCKDLCGQ